MPFTFCFVNLCQCIYVGAHGCVLVFHFNMQYFLRLSWPVLLMCAFILDWCFCQHIRSEKEAEVSKHVIAPSHQHGLRSDITAPSCTPRWFMWRMEAFHHPPASQAHHRMLLIHQDHSGEPKDWLKWFLRWTLGEVEYFLWIYKGLGHVIHFLKDLLFL